MVLKAGLKIGLTGGVATGKSTVTAYLRSHGIPVFDADAEVHKLLANNVEVASFLEATFGSGVFTETPATPRASQRQVNRKALGALVFANPALRKALEEELHPRVRQAMLAFFEAHSHEVLAVADVPLLLETGHTELYDEVWLVYATEGMQRQRMKEQRGWDEATINQRLAAQWPIEQKRSHAKRVLENTGSLKELYAQIDALLERFN